MHYQPLFFGFCLCLAHVSGSQVNIMAMLRCVTNAHKTLEFYLLAFKPVETNSAVQNGNGPAATPEEAYFAEAFDANTLDRFGFGNSLTTS